MSRACPQFEPLLIDLAAGDVPPADLARLEAHLAGCDTCRAEAGVFGQALALAALPPAPPAEREAAARGAGETIARHRRRHRRGLAGGLLAIAASIAIAIGVPRLVRSPGSDAAAPPAPVASRAAAGEAAAANAAGTDAAAMDWQVPDLDAVWAASAVADPDAALEGEPTPEPEMLFAEALEVNDAD